MLAPLKPISLQGPKLNLVDAGPEGVVALGNHVVTFSDLDLGFAVPIALQADSHSPAPDAIALHQRVRRHIEVLNPDAIALAT
jgi:hypothetical protein